MFGGTPAQLSSMKVKSAGDLFSYLDRNKVERVIGFYSLPSNTSGLGPTAEAIIRGTRSRVITLLSPGADSWSQFTSGQFSEAVLRQYLQPQGLLQGVGELVLYQPEMQSVTFDSPVMQTVFQVVNEKKGIVMVQLSTASQGPRPTELAEIEPSIRRYPDAIFLFHGNDEVFNLVVQLMSKYPNVYFTMDATHNLCGGLLYPLQAEKANAEGFLTEGNRIGFNKLLEEGFAKVAPRLLQYPDRIMWGTDLSAYWHFEDSVTDVVISLSRQLIGRLPADLQEKYAYQNAQRVFGRFLTPNP